MIAFLLDLVNTTYIALSTQPQDPKYHLSHYFMLSLDGRLRAVPWECCTISEPALD